MKRKLVRGVLLSAASFLVIGSAAAGPVSWTDWTSIGSNSASGTMGGVTVSVSSTTAMNGVSQTGCGVNYWTEPNAADPAYTGGTVSNAPTACEQVGLNSANTVTVNEIETVTGGSNSDVVTLSAETTGGVKRA